MTDIKSMTLSELKEYLISIGQPAFRAGQLYGWMHSRCVSGIEEMTNIPKSLKIDITNLKIAEVKQSSDGTRKYLFELPDQELIESVLMRYKYGNTVCVSSQVGCRMGCRFCASTLNGLTRNLTPAEILDQIYKITADINERISHVVVMGMGEPMDNYANVIKFLNILISEEGYNLSRRNITVSTCGIAEKIRELADENLGVTLAVSLHAPTDELRRTIMPIANRYTIEEIADSAAYFFEKTGRRITFEYALSRDVNDTDECAEKLSALCRRLGAHVNLIPVNPVTGRGYVPSDLRRVSAFKNKLEKQGINVTIRRELGQDIDGACGQLRNRHGR